ncbi:hypothetical protein [Rhizobium sp. LjRoot258]|jgi:hypothetical protein|uniref:hypothetical protein n=1 Tax=Rhizobium sp. LjRoot258 TaxID=3342299 RepID=UPI003ECE3649
MHVAELTPSKASPWSGTVIVQAKHTNAYNKHFSETNFFNGHSENTVIGTEVPRQGPIVLTIENYQSGLLWDLMRKWPHVTTGLRHAGFSGGWLSVR